MTSLSRQAVKIGPTIRLPDFFPSPIPLFLKLSQYLPVIPHGVGRETPFLRQMPEKCGRLWIGHFARFRFQAAALARAFAVLALLGLRGSRGGKSKETFPSFHMRKAENGRRVLLEINFSKRAVFPLFNKSCTSETVISRFRIFFETLNVQVEGLATLFSQTYRSWLINIFPPQAGH